MPPTRTLQRPSLETIPPPSLPPSITPSYTPTPSSQTHTERRPLSEEERGRLIHELVGFHPRSLCNDITEVARTELYNAMNSIENWAETVARGKELSAEAGNGMHALETLLETHFDRAFDKYETWLLRNAFEFEKGLDVVLPWHNGLDFTRGEHVSLLPGGTEALDTQLESLRVQVEQTRQLSMQLELANKKLDKRLDTLRQREAHVGFVKEVVETSGLNPLPQNTTHLTQTVSSLHTSLLPLESIPIHTSTSFTRLPDPSHGPGSGSGEHTKAWELGRAAYLNWAMGKMVPSASSSSSAASAPGSGEGQPAASTGEGGAGGGGDKLEAIEQGIEQVGGKEGMEVLAESVKE
ncbi:hypothetical protein B9479_007671 [Cryptococcus floricola]|uniref:Kinetochore protein Mis12/MTW1 n=1 Tax=Cryptococcus floricola TaxID=2591691 RepID=A0A5D3AJN5_9TREE|nr:hypothetical protein B9479_007671 [Cryptococcus floricola]